MLDAEIGEADAAAAAQQTPIPVEVNAPVPELSLVELTQRSGTTNPEGLMISHSSSRIG